MSQATTDNGGARIEASSTRQSCESFANRLFSFAFRPSAGTLYAGEHYQPLARFLVPTVTQPPLPAASYKFAETPRFIYVHTDKIDSSGHQKRRVAEWKRCEDLDEHLNTPEGNQIIFLCGYPSPEWLSQLGSSLNLSYEFLHQHWSNRSQLIVNENYCLPPLSLATTGTLQLTFTSIASWNNHSSGIGLASARTTFDLDMKDYLDTLNNAQGPKLGDSLVRSFHLHDLRHFSIEQQITMQLTESDGAWRVIIWTDAARSLSHTRCGPWKSIERTHSSSSRFLPIPLDYTNKIIRKLSAQNSTVATSEGAGNNEASVAELHQTLSVLPTKLGALLDHEVAFHCPFYAIHEIYRLFAASEQQFLNLMEEKIRDRRESRDDIRSSISELQLIKRLTKTHHGRLIDALESIETRGGRIWRRPSANADGPSHEKAEWAAEEVTVLFKRLQRQAEGVYQSCMDEMSVLSNDSMVQEAQKSMQVAESIGKVTLIVSVFVPLSFTTSFFGMNISQLNDSGLDIGIWFAVTVPVLLLTMLALWLNPDKVERAKNWLAVHLEI